MTVKRRLADLYVVGKEVTIDDGAGEPVTVWLQKVNPVEHETARRRANAERSRALTIKNDLESDEAYALRDQVERFVDDRERLIEFIVTDKINVAGLTAEAEVSFRDEWSNDDYLQGLRDGWEDHLKAEFFAGDEPTPESKRVFEELQKFEEQVQKEIGFTREALLRDYERYTLEQLQQKAFEREIEVNADLEWLKEYQRSQLWLAVREPDNHKKRYFQKREELDEISGPVLDRLLNEYNAISVDVTEGKGSPETDTSSTSPPLPEQEETPASSGLSAVEP